MTMPGSTTDLAIPYALPADPRAEWPATNLSMSERIAALLRGVQFSIGDGLVGDGAPGTPLKTALSGIWGQNRNNSALLDVFGDITLASGLDTAGPSIFLDTLGELRAAPLVINGPAVNRLNADLPNNYPLGPSVLALSNAQAASGGWPLGFSAIVLTNMREANVGNQLWMRYGKTLPEYHIKYRAGDIDGWGPWADVLTVDTGWVVGAAAFTAFATNFTMIDAWARLKNGRVQFMVNGTMKVTSNSPTDGSNIVNVQIGTMTAQFTPAATVPWDYPLTSIGAGRGVFGYVTGGAGAGKIMIGAIAGNPPLAAAEGVSLGGTYLID